MKKDRWSPYLVGALIGVLSWITILFLHKPLGTSTTFVHISAFIESLFTSHEIPYYTKVLKKSPLIDWQFAVVIGIFFGALFASRLSPIKHIIHVPPTWAKRFGPSKLKRYIGAFIGGVIILFGARLAGGCTSGHGISGGLQFALSGWLFVLASFGIGIPYALIFYGRK